MTPPDSLSRFYVHADDDADECDLFRDALLLAEPDARLVSLQTGNDLCTFLDTLHPNLVFIDLEMPGPDGFDCLAAIRRQPHYAELPVVVYSGMSDEGTIQRAYSAGADLYLVKPFTFNELAEAVRAILVLNWNDLAGIRQRVCGNGTFRAFNDLLPGNKII